MNTLFTALLLLCGLQFIVGQPVDTHEKTIDSILHEIEKRATEDEKMDVLGANFTKYRTSPHSKKLVNKALSIAGNSKKPITKANSYRYLGIYYYHSAKLDSSLIALERANNYITQNEAPVLKASILGMMGGVYSRTGNIQRGISLMLDAQRIIDKTDALTMSEEARTRYVNENLVLANSLANAYNQVEEYDAAIENYDRAYRGYENLGKKIESGIILNNKGDLYLKMKDYDQALQVLLHANTLIVSNNAPKRFVGLSNLNIGIAHVGLKNYAEAKKYLDEAFSIYKEINNNSGLAYALTHRGELHTTTNDFEKAKQDCETALALAAKSNNLEYQLKASKCLYEALENLGEYEAAFKIHKTYDQFKDSIFNVENVKKLTQLQMQYEFDQVQEAQRLQAQKVEQQRKVYLYLSLTGLLVAALVGFFLYKNNKKNKLLANQKALLEATVDEKNVLLKETHHRVKNSFQIVSSLLYLQSENIKDHEAQLAMKEAQNRVRSMVLIHQKLYSKDQLVGINTEEYFSDLVHDIFESHQTETNQIEYELQVEPLVLSVETITPLGLILNELITNVIKHAFTENTSENKMRISLKKESDATLTLKVVDNGKGMAGTVPETSFGIRLIKALSKKLRGTLTYISNKPKGVIAQLTINRFTEL